jgi:hypothetical protein
MTAQQQSAEQIRQEIQRLEQAQPRNQQAIDEAKRRLAEAEKAEQDK